MSPLPALPTITEWRDRPLTPGNWAWQRRPDTGWSEADFGTPERVAVFCVSPGGVRMAVQHPGGALTIRTSELSRVIPSAAQSIASHPVPVLNIDFVATDPLLDAIAFSRGRFMLDMGGDASLILPTGPEFARVVEDCR